MLYAQPYNRDAKGFFFSDEEELKKGILNSGAEEFEIGYKGEDEKESHIFDCLEIDASNCIQFLEAIEAMDEHEKLKLAIYLEAGGDDYDLGDDVEDLDINYHEVDSLKALAESFIDEGLYGDIPKTIMYYIDMELLGRDLGHEYSETEIGGTTYFYLTL